MKHFWMKTILCLCVCVLSVGQIQAALEDDLIGRWRLDEGTGAVGSNDVDGGNDAQLLGDIAWTADAAQGSFAVDNALGVNGVANRLSLGVINLPEDYITIMFYAKGGNSGHISFMASSTGGGANQPGFRIQSANDNGEYVEVEMGSGGVNRRAKSEKGFWSTTDGQWHHIAVVMDRTQGRVDGTLQIFIDGVDRTNPDASEVNDLFPIDREIRVCQTASTTETYTGKIDDLRIYNRLLTADEIAQALRPSAILVSPADGGFVFPDQVNGIDLEWILPEPNDAGTTVTCDVWVYDAEDPNWSVQLLDDSTLSTVNFPNPEPDKDYQWQVNCHDPSLDDPCLPGPLWTFNTRNIPPVVDAGTYQTVFLNSISGEATVALDDAVVTDDGRPDPPAMVTYEWEIIESPDGATISWDPSSTVLHPFLTVDQPGDYVVELRADDGGENITADQASFTVAEPTCQYRIDNNQIIPGDIAGPGGPGPDCYLDLYDFEAMTSNWLNCNHPADQNCDTSP